MKLLALSVSIAGLLTWHVSGQTFRTSTPDERRPSGLVVGFGLHDYFGETYTERSPASAIFFARESVAFKVIVANVGAANSALVASAVNPQALFRVQAFAAPPLPPGSSIERPFAGDRYADERETTVPLTFSAPTKVWSGGSFDIQLERETPLNQGESLEWLLSVQSGNLTPGIYRVVVKVNGSEPNQRAVQGSANFSFELRPARPEAEPEMRRREAIRRYLRDDYSGARQAVGDLLRVHPDSYEAQLLLVRIADAEGKPAEAATHRANADALLLSGRDQLLTRHTPKNRLQEMIESRKGAR